MEYPHLIVRAGRNGEAPCLRLDISDSEKVFFPLVSRGPHSFFVDVADGGTGWGLYHQPARRDATMLLLFREEAEAQAALTLILETLSPEDHAIKIHGVHSLANDLGSPVLVSSPVSGAPGDDYRPADPNSSVEEASDTETAEDSDNQLSGAGDEVTTQVETEAPTSTWRNAKIIAALMVVALLAAVAYLFFPGKSQAPVAPNKAPSDISRPAATEPAPATSGVAEETLALPSIAPPGAYTDLGEELAMPELATPEATTGPDSLTGSEQALTEQAMIEQAMIEQATSDQAVGEQATPEQAVTDPGLPSADTAGPMASPGDLFVKKMSGTPTP